MHLPNRHKRDDEEEADMDLDGPPQPLVNDTPFPWKRVMLKISGEALSGAAGFGIDHRVVKEIAAECAHMSRQGVQLAVVVGGGNFFRGKNHEGKGLDRVTADYMGMLATMMNALSFQAAIESCGSATRIQSAIEMKEVAEPYIRRRAIRHLEKGRVVIFGAGTGNPFFSTDTAAALRAAEMSAQCLLKATKVDGIYDSDPKLNPSASLHRYITYQDVMRQGLNVMDATAITLCRENEIPLVVFSLLQQGNITRVLSGEPLGTQVGEAPEAPQGRVRMPVPPHRVER